MRAATVISSDGTAIAVDVLGDGPPLVLLHGSVASADYWREVMPALAERFSVHAVERRGRGRSPAANHTLALEVQDTIAVLESLPSPAHLLGHSWGGVVALRAARLTDRIDRLIVYEPPLPLSGPVVRDLDALAEAHALGGAGDWDGALHAAIRSIGVPPEYHLDLAMSNTPISWERMVEVAPSWLPELDECVTLSTDPADWSVPQPALILVGTENSQRRMQRLLFTQPNARMWSLPGQGHEAAITAPEVFSTEVLRFLTA